MSYSLGEKCLAEFMGSWGAIYLCQSIVSNAILPQGKGNGIGFGWISFGYGMGFLFPILAFWDMPALFNPAFCIALWILGSLHWYEVFVLSACQVSGAFCGAVCVWIHYKPHFDLPCDPSVKLACFTTSPAIYTPFYNFTCEFMSTISLVVGVIMTADRLACSVEDHLSYVYGPFFIAIYIIVLLLGLGGPTALSVNPARDVGPRLAHFVLPIRDKGSSEWRRYGWIPVVASLCGGAVGGAMSLGIRKSNIIQISS
jgi:glycerol uptake facilitator protein